MSTPANPSKDRQVAPSQLCVGMFVHLDLPWTDHPFTFSSFKIKSLEQVATIQTLGLSRVRFSPERSDTEPLELPAVETALAESPPPREQDPVYQNKRERLERIAAHHTKAAACERAMMSNARALKSINQNMFARPEAAHQEALQLVDGIANSMLVDADMAIELMADKIGGEDAYFHALNVTIMAMMLAKEMKAPAAAVRLIGLGALLHDIGKVDIPDRILRKGAPWTLAEFGVVQLHCAKGVAIAQKMGVSQEALRIIEQHHEHVDGSGYPMKLVGAQLNLLSKIVALANTYDNLCNPVDLQRALTPHEALSTMYGQRRGQFDAAAMTTFVRCVGIYPPGTIVALSNGTLGMVVTVNSSRPLKPTVLVYDPAVPKEVAMVVDLEQEPDVTVTKTLRPQQLPQPVYDYLSPRKRMTYYFHTDAGKSMP
ncbi:HD-GYP domain-containing protein [Roseateles microcysteis]|uniref:HD-GYP domain-containing protein n=1 Tax=Roseateles microcysteis TaxID=3119057 RepID=UPI002FE61E72